jgi:hypothetical protein
MKLVRFIKLVWKDFPFKEESLWLFIVMFGYNICVAIGEYLLPVSQAEIEDVPFLAVRLFETMVGILVCAGTVGLVKLLMVIGQWMLIRWRRA